MNTIATPAFARTRCRDCGDPAGGGRALAGAPPDGNWLDQVPRATASSAGKVQTCWRTSGSDGRISYFKRRYGFDHTLLDDLAGAQTWCGLGVLAHNSVKIAHLLIQTQQSPAATQTRPSRRRSAQPPAPGAAATGPPPDPLPSSITAA